MTAGFRRDEIDGLTISGDFDIPGERGGRVGRCPDRSGPELSGRVSEGRGGLRAVAYPIARSHPSHWETAFAGLSVG